VNAREHRVTRRAPAVALVDERKRLHPLPDVPHTLCFGETRRVSSQSTISVGGAIYSVPRTLVDERVWARAEGDELVVVHADGAAGPREVARHELTILGRPRIVDTHLLGVLLVDRVVERPPVGMLVHDLVGQLKARADNP
jgi:hypothetical protein